MSIKFPISVRCARRLCWLALFTAVLQGGAFSRAHAQSVELTWNPSTNTDIVAYIVYYGTQSNALTNYITYADVTEAVISGLISGDTYYFAVAAVDVNGLESRFSGEASCVFPYPDEIVLQAEAVQALQSVELTWDPGNGSDAYAYEVNYGTQSGALTNSTIYYYVTDVVIPGLTAGTTNYFTVSAIDDSGDVGPPSNIASFVVAKPQPIVLQAGAAPAAVEAVALTWNPGSGGVVSEYYGYSVYYGTQSGVYINSTSFYGVTNGVVTGLVAGSTNYFAVSAFDEYGDTTPLSNEARYVVPYPNPIVLKAQTAPAAVEAVQLTWNPGTNGGIYAYYNVYYGTQSGVYNNATSFFGVTNGVVTGLVAGSTNYFAVTAVDNYGDETPLSNQATNIVAYPTPIVLKAQAAPGVVEAVQLTWNPGTNGGIYAYYNVYYGTQSGVYINSTSFYGVTNGVVTGLVAGSTNYFAVTAVDNYGDETPLSNQATNIVAYPTPIVLKAQAAPGAVEAVALTWNPGTNGGIYAYYNVYYGTQSGVYNNATSFFGVTNGVVPGLVPGTTNYFAVTAVDNYGDETPLSNQATNVVAYPNPIVLKAQAAPAVQGVSLTWNPGSGGGVYAYYNVYYGTQSGVYNNSTTFTGVTNGVLPGLVTGATNFFAVSAVDNYGDTTPLSNEASVFVALPARIALQTQIFTDDNNQPYLMEITAKSAVYGSWEMDTSTDLQNWTPYEYGYGSGTGDDVDVDIYLDLTQTQVFFRVINY